MILKENFTGEQRQEIVIEGGDIIGDYFEKIKQLENIGDDKEIMGVSGN